MLPILVSVELYNCYFDFVLALDSIWSVTTWLNWCAIQLLLKRKYHEQHERQAGNSFKLLMILLCCELWRVSKSVIHLWF
jgi:hypothetical protein